MTPLRIFPPREEKRLAYSEARGIVHSGDVLLWRPTTLLGRWIAKGTKAKFSHASMAGWEPNGERNPNRRLRNVELVQWHGGRHQLLSDQVSRFPGIIDVYRPDPPYDGDRALEWMIWLSGQHYGWLDFGTMLLRRGLKWALPPLADSPDPDYPRVCSAGVAYAVHYGGGRKVDPQQSDFLVFPGELAEPFAKYVGTLYPDPNGEARDVAA